MDALRERPFRGRLTLRNTEGSLVLLLRNCRIAEKILLSNTEQGSLIHEQLDLVLARESEAAKRQLRAYLADLNSLSDTDLLKLDTNLRGSPS